jgi:hypothetical protein
MAGVVGHSAGDMNDLVYIAVMVAAFLAAQGYARWCGKL